MTRKNSKYQVLLTTRGPREGACNICGAVGKLTEDHTPPKSCLGVTASEMHLLFSRLSDTPAKPGRHFRTGPSFRTLCGRCNNELLGAIYDPALAHFSSEVRRLTNTRLLLPNEIALEIQPQLVVRSVMGHLAAMGVNRYLKGDLTESFRDYMLDKTLPLPQPVRFYYWLYPYRPQILVRDAATLNTGSKVITLFWLMKFFPLAFLVTFDEPEHRQFDLPNLDAFRAEPYDARRQIGVRLRPLMHPSWPESPTDQNVTLYGEQAVTVLPRSHIVRA